MVAGPLCKKNCPEKLGEKIAQASLEFLTHATSKYPSQILEIFTAKSKRFSRFQGSTLIDGVFV